MARGPVPSGVGPRSRHRRWRAASSKLACRWLQHGEATSEPTNQHPWVTEKGNARIAFAWPTLSRAGLETTVTVVQGSLSAAGFPWKATRRGSPVGLRYEVGIDNSDSFFAPPLGVACGSPASLSLECRTTRSRSPDLPSGRSGVDATGGLRASRSVKPRPSSAASRSCRFEDTIRAEGSQG
jgi:hypothetical protein